MYSINYKVFLVIFAVLVGFQIYIEYLVENGNIVELESIVFAISFLSPATAACAAFFIYRKYDDSQVFSKPYFALFLSFIMIFFGEITYFVYQDILKFDPYPSLADIFFFAFYPLALYHIRANIKSFFKLTDKKTIVIVGILSSLTVAAYAVLSLLDLGATADIGTNNNIVENGEIFSSIFIDTLLTFDVLYGIAFVAAASVTFWYSVMGIITFHRGSLETVWIILVAGISFLTLGDATYFHAEILGEYTLYHHVNLLWYAGYMVIVYALYKQIKTI